MKFEIFDFKIVKSTNDEAIHLIKNKKKDSGCIFAEGQTEGRGTHGKKWISNKGNLFGSIFFPLRRNYPSFNEFFIINPILISGVIKQLCKNKEIALKFPNDIFINGKKVCGILQEVITLKSKKFLIIGIGLNIVTNPIIRKKYKATNIFDETKKKPNIKDVINLIIYSYENFFTNLNTYDYLSFKKKAEKMSLN
tara:strand:- start:6871 stop:7455 length:585 start_codon:yes stop_codon:yes gene_type:complete